MILLAYFHWRQHINDNETTVQSQVNLQSSKPITSKLLCYILSI